MCGKYCSIEHEDMSPTQPITVICLHQNQMVYQKKTWGYTVTFHSSRIINARCETLFSKKFFKKIFNKEDVLSQLKVFIKRIVRIILFNL